MTNDMSQWVVLSENFHNARIREFEYNLPDGNLAIVTGSGTGRTRSRLEVGDATLTGIKRREIHVTSSSSDDMQTTGEKALEEAKSYSVDMELTRQEMYGKNFTLGDVVSCDLGKYGAYALQVVEAEISYSAEARKVSLTLGNAKKGVMRVIRDSITANTLLRQ